MGAEFPDAAESETWKLSPFQKSGSGDGGGASMGQAARALDPAELSGEGCWSLLTTLLRGWCAVAMGLPF